MTEWYHPPNKWKPPGIPRRTRRLFSALWLSLLITLNTIQPALALSATTGYSAATGATDYLASDVNAYEANTAIANFFAVGATGTITNTVTVGSTTDDPNPINNSAIQTTTVTSEADLQISKTNGVDSALPGTVITYTIVVGNAGPSAVTGAPVTDPLPVEITSANWTCGASTGSSCGTASGTGDIATSVDLPVNGTATFTVVATLSPTATGSVANTATITTPIDTTDPDPDNNEDTDTDNLLTGILTGTVYLDADGDANYDGGEGLVDVTVVVTTSVGYTFTVTTDADGNYTATVPAGDAAVDVNDNDLPIGAVQIEGDDPTTVTVPAGGSAGTVDGYEQQGQVTGHIYLDINGDGNQDPGEPDLPSVTVVITDTFGVTQTVTTDTNGNYTATVPIGATTADVDETTLPAGSLQTEGTDPTSATAIAGSTVDIGIDGYQQQGTVEGTVYTDENGDGVYTPGTDTPLSSVSVVITDSTGVTYTVTTNASGYFNQIVPAGNTTVDVNDTDLPAGVVLTTGSTDPTTVAVPGGGVATDNTGYLILSNIGDFIWLDLNGDGVQDANEPGLADVEVELTQPDSSTITTTTSANGIYNFTDLTPGTYTVTVVSATLPAGVTQTFDPDTLVDHQHAVTIFSASNYTAADFGYQGSASIGDLVWLDSDGDSSRDLDTEVGIPGVVLTLTMESGAVVTTTTNAVGGYDFGGLIAGTYTVTVDTNTLPTGAVLTTGNQPLSVNLTATEDYNLADFGYQRQAELTGHVFEDTDGDGTQDVGEPNLSNITIIITDSLGITQSVTTDANGNYTATVPVDSTTAPTDTITVDVDENTLPAGAIQTAGTDPDTVEVSAGDSTDAGDDGYQIQGVVEGTVYEDVNQNGSYDAGTDVPLVSVSVTITDSNGVIYTVNTDASGYFSQTVPAGNTGVDVDNGDVAAINADLMIENGFTDPDSVIVPGGGVGTTNFPYVEPLTIDKDALTPTVIAGEQVTYTVVMRNIGGLLLTGVTISDTLPAGFTYAGHTVTAADATRTSTANPTAGDAVPTWSAWTINAGGAVTITFVADVAASVASGTYDNTATANSDQTSQVDDDGAAAQDDNTPLDEDPENDEDVTVSTQADLSVLKLDDPDPVVAGSTLTYTIQIFNAGPSNAENVVVTDDLSDDTTFVDATPGCAPSGNNIVCNLGTVTVGATVNITIVVTVAPDLIAYGGDANHSALAAAPATNGSAEGDSPALSAPAAGTTAANDDLAARPVPNERPYLPPTSALSLSGGGGGPSSPTVGSGLTAATVGTAGTLTTANAEQLQRLSIEQSLAVTAADGLIRDGPSGVGLSDSQ